jgi:hypothetical protein
MRTATSFRWLVLAYLALWSSVAVGQAERAAGLSHTNQSGIPRFGGRNAALSIESRLQNREASHRLFKPEATAGVRRLVPLDYSTIQYAINACADGDTVLVAEGVYFENINYKGKAIVVASTYLTTGDTSHISRTIIDGSLAGTADSGSVVYFISGEDTNSVLCGFTITGGSGTYLTAFFSREGGGVLCLSGARLVRNTIAGNNLSGDYVYGGGVSADAGQMLIMEQNVVKDNIISGGWAVGAGIQVYSMAANIRENVITDNTATTQGNGSASHGGGISCEQGTFVLNNNIVARNRALAPTAAQNACYGGGVLVRNGTLEFRNNRVVDNLIQTSNSVSTYGGGVCLLAALVSELGEMTLSGNYIRGNSALGGVNTIGGGIAIRNEKPRIENNIIEKNIAVNGGGIGIEGSLSSPPAVLVNNTIYDNNATLGGGAILRGGGIAVAFNNIFWADSAQSQAEISVSGSTAEVRYCDVQGGYPGTSNIDSIPEFVVGDTTFNLDTSSQCIGRGKDSIQVAGVWYYAPGGDYDGDPRHRPTGPQSSDIGAQEEQVTTDVRVGRAELPNWFALEQNYPNPFNPSTRIGYSIPPSSRYGVGSRETKLVVYDILGREVAVLVNEKKAPGRYEVEFDGSGLASGIYFYRLSAGTYVECRKMVLMK